eukprot:2958719-Amphidinium_carterae.2
MGLIDFGHVWISAVRRFKRYGDLDKRCSVAWCLILMMAMSLPSAVLKEHVDVPVGRWGAFVKTTLTQA